MQNKQLIYMHAHKIYDLIDNDVQSENYITDDQNFQILGGKFSILGVKYGFFNPGFQILPINNALLKNF